jgi:hypothetical protein
MKDTLLNESQMERVSDELGEKGAVQSMDANSPTITSQGRGAPRQFPSTGVKVEVNRNKTVQPGQMNQP